MNISHAAVAAGLTVKTVRYYADIGLVEPDRQSNGYRSYGDRHIHALQFVARARGLGFSIDECRSLLGLYNDHGRASADVKRLAEARLADIDLKLAELTSLRDTLAGLVHACRGDDRPDCPILADLAQGTAE